MTGFLVDTNVISEDVKPRPAPQVSAWLHSVPFSSLHISVLALGELRAGIVHLRPSKRRSRLEGWLDDELRPAFEGRILPIDEGVAERWGWLEGEALRAGRPLPTADGLLAASALHFGLTLATRDWRPLAGTGVVYFDPWTY